MIRIAGIMLLLSMSALTGCLAAQSLKKRLTALRQLRIMLEKLRLMIRYEAPEVSEIAERLSRESGLSELEFLSAVCESITKRMDSGEASFYEIWNDAVDRHSGSFSAEDIMLIKRIGSSLGSCDCDGQIAMISLACEEADRLIMSADDQYKSKGRLYRSLGAVAGALLAVIAV